LQTNEGVVLDSEHLTIFNIIQDACSFDQRKSELTLIAETVAELGTPETIVEFGDTLGPGEVGHVPGNALLADMLRVDVVPPELQTITDELQLVELVLHDIRGVHAVS
jgi:hypothetical protein